MSNWPTQRSGTRASPGLDRVSANLDRRFEAYLFVGDVAVSSVASGTAGSSLRELRACGAPAGLVGDTPAPQRAGHLGDPAPDVFAGSELAPLYTAERDGSFELPHALDWLLWRLWELGVAAGEVLLFGTRAPLEALAASRWLREVAVAPVGEPPKADPAVAIGAVLADQLARRRAGAAPQAAVRPGWSIEIAGADPQLVRVHDTLLSLADGQLGVSGAVLGGVPGERGWAVHANVYTVGGAESRLLTLPHPFTEPVRAGEPRKVLRVLDLHSNVLYETDSVDSAELGSARFVSLARPGTAVLRVSGRPPARAARLLADPLDDDVSAAGHDDVGEYACVVGDGIGVVAAASAAPAGSAASAATRDAANVDRVTVYRASPVAEMSAPPVAHEARAALEIGFDRLLSEHRAAWARRWRDCDVVVDGDPELQTGVRFALNRLISSVADTGEAAVGARGLHGTSYRGHVFWDADTFVLPFLAATHPAAARAMLEYRIRRLPVAREIAAGLGRAGARFPWESARTGFDVTPHSARDRTGRLTEIRTGQLEEHIVAQVAWAAACYVDWSGDDEFGRGAGAQLLTETARYWASRVHIGRDGRAHIYDVIGPDEYHEAVDDNACTNVLARWNLRRAAAVVTAARDTAVGSARDADSWRELADRLVDGYDPQTQLYEQFAGFYRLEPLIIAEVAPRRPIAADLLLGPERVQCAQVVKQADVLMLHHLVPDEVAPGSLLPNLRYYEPRTAHGSSLSPAIFAGLFARVDDAEHALAALRMASRIDLDDLTGTTATGLHLATMGGLWQALAFGFAGLRAAPSGLVIDPHVPPAWNSLELTVRFRGSRVRVCCRQNSFLVRADPAAVVVVAGQPHEVGAGGSEFRRRDAGWVAAHEAGRERS